MRRPAGDVLMNCHVRAAFLIAILLLSGCAGPATPIASPTPQPTPSPTAVAAVPPPRLVGSPTGDERKVDTVLLDVLTTLRSSGRQAAEEQARATGVLTKSNDVRVTLVLATNDTKPVVDRVQSMGGRVVSVSDNLIDIVVPLDTIMTYVSAGRNFLQDLAAFSAVREVRASAIASPEELRFPAARLDTATRALLAKIVSEGVAATGADKWHAAGITGKGIRVGIIDIGFSGYEALLGAELPAKVTAKPFNSSGAMYDDASAMHGTAVAEIVHAMAPDAELSLAAIGGTAAELSLAVRWLVDEQQVQVIQMSLGWQGTRGDGTGPYAEAVDYARSKGVLFVKSAGNEANGHYTATYTDSDGNGWHEFGPGVENLRVVAGTNSLSVILTWDAWGARSVNYDLYVLTLDGKLLSSSRNDQGAGKAPVESVTYQVRSGQTYLVRVAQVAGPTPPVRMDIFTKNSTIPEYDTPAYSLSTPADARGALAVGAIQWKNDQLEAYSSQGPTLDERLKPELVGPTRVSTTAYSSKGKVFNGTSAAAPHVAGAAALVFNVLRDASATSVSAFLESRARDLTEPGPDNKTGYGGLQLGAPTMTPPPATVAASPPPAALPPGTSAVRATASAPASGATGASPGFVDRFVNASTGLPSTDESRYGAGQYVVRPNASNRAVWASYGPAYTAMTVEALVTLSGTSGMAGIVFWQATSDDYYVFSVTSDGYYQISRYERSTWREVTKWTKAAAVGTGGPLRLTVETRDTTITVSVNGTLLSTTRVLTPGAGRVGMMAATFDRPGFSATFTEFQVAPAR